MTTPTYDPNQPPKPDSIIGQAQPPFLTNFMNLYNAFQNNHVALDSTIDPGDHTTIQLLNQISEFQTSTGEISLYSRNLQEFTEGKTLQPEQVFLRFEGNQPEFQYTNYQIYPLEPTDIQTSFFTFLPGGLIVYFGTILVNFSSPASVIALKLLPEVSKKIMSVNLCPIGIIPSASPWINWIQNIKGIYTTIELHYTFITPRAPTKISYLIIGNT